MYVVFLVLLRILLDGAGDGVLGVEGKNNNIKINMLLCNYN